MASQPAQSDTTGKLRFATDTEWALNVRASRAEAELARLRAGISWVRGMCTDREPLELIDAKLGEILNGAAPDQERADG